MATYDPQAHRRRFLAQCLLTLACLAFAAPALAADPPDVRVMSFNIRVGSADQNSPNDWDLRKPLVVETIRDFTADLVGLQEDLSYQGTYLDTELTSFNLARGQAARGGNDGEYCAILYRRSRFTLLDQGTFWLSDTPNDPGSNTWDAAVPRLANWVKLADKLNPGSSLVFLNTHWDHVSTTARQSSALLIREKLEKIAGPLPVVVSGDFNAAIDSVAYNRMIGITNHDDYRHYIDTFRDVNPNATTGIGTAHGFNGGRGGDRIDWILQNGFSTLDADIVRTNYDVNYENQYPSDHFPITAVIEVVPEPASLTAVVTVFTPLLLRRNRRRAPLPV